MSNVKCNRLETYKEIHQLKPGIWKRSNSLRAPSMRGNSKPLSTFQCVLFAWLPMSPTTLNIGIVHCMGRLVTRQQKGFEWGEGAEAAWLSRVVQCTMFVHCNFVHCTLNVGNVHLGVPKKKRNSS